VLFVTSVVDLRMYEHGERIKRLAMRKHHVIAVVVVVLVGLGVKQVFFPPKATDIGLITANMNILQIHLDHPNLPTQEMHDMTFVFDSK
jgi:hypothetical protein